MKKDNFYVIGGQYESCCYGGAPTLIGAKRLANKNEEFWDNWQGWHTPRIYHADDTVEIELKRFCHAGCIIMTDGAKIRVPKIGAVPVQ